LVHDKEEQARLIRQTSKQAIALALEGRWRDAADANKGILESFPDDIDTLNRLGRACIELGEYTEARNAYARASEIDPYNTIAEKNLRRLEHLDSNREGNKSDGGTKLNPNTFIEEMGKAGVLCLQQVGSKEVLARLVAGDKVVLVAADGKLHANSEKGEFLGVVEARHGQRLARLMAGGNKYSASITSLSEESLSIIIRETFQHPNQAGMISFPSKGVGNTQQFDGDRFLRRFVENDENLAEEPGDSAISEDEEVDPESLDESGAEEEIQQ